MAVLKEYNYGLLYRRYTSKYFNMHEYSLLEAENLWHVRDSEFDQLFDDSMNGLIEPENDIVFLYERERRMIEIPNGRILYVTRDKGGLWIFTKYRWVLLNPTYRGVRGIPFTDMDVIFKEVEEGKLTNPKFYSDIRFLDECQRNALIKPDEEVLYVIRDTGKMWFYEDEEWHMIISNIKIDDIKRISEKKIDEIVGDIGVYT